MLTRRHIRVKVVQSVYAFNQSDYQDLDKQEKFLLYSLDQMMDLYLLMLQLLVSLRDQEERYLLKAQKKHLATAEAKDPSQAFINNKMLSLIASNPAFQEAVKN